MVTAVRDFSLEQHLVDRLRYCGMERENLSDLISITASLKNKYGIQLFTVSAFGGSVPAAPPRDACVKPPCSINS